MTEPSVEALSTKIISKLVILALFRDDNSEFMQVDKWSCPFRLGIMIENDGLDVFWDLDVVANFEV